MARTYYDDGSYIDNMADGSTVGYNTAGIAVNKVEADGDYFQGPTYWTDARESQKLNAYTAAPAGTENMEWWERLAAYGATRAIDAQFGPPATNKTGQAATYAGQNGRTYTAGGQATTTAPGSSWMVPALIAAAAFFALG